MVDDRPSYWLRLLIWREAARHGAASTALSEFERASRGRDFSFRDDVDRRVIVTGFDPFDLDANVEQCNPSGAVALAFHDRVVQIGGLTVQFKTSIIPVRFADFDSGHVEDLLGPQLEGGRVDLVATVSMGRNAFDLERFPGRRRSATKQDNEGVLGAERASKPVIPFLGARSLDGPEFLEFSLPHAAMLRVAGRFPVRVNSEVTTLESGTFTAESLSQLAGHTAVSGSGGGYLSNEIGYRTLRLASQKDLRISVGHIHTPRIKGYDPHVVTDIVAQTHALLRAALS